VFQIRAQIITSATKCYARYDDGVHNKCYRLVTSHLTSHSRDIGYDFGAQSQLLRKSFLMISASHPSQMMVTALKQVATVSVHIKHNIEFINIAPSDVL